MLILRGISPTDDITGTPMTSLEIPPMQAGVFPIVQVSDLVNDSFIRLFLTIPSSAQTI